MFKTWITRNLFVVPEGFDRNKLLRKLASWCATYEPMDKFWRSPDANDLEHQIAHDLMTVGLEQLDAIDRPLHSSHRHELLRLMTRRNEKLLARREHAVAYVEEHIDYVSGWSRLVLVGQEYQLGEPRAWYKPTDVFDLLHAIEELDPIALEREGYVQIDQADYRKRIKRDLISTLLTRHTVHKPEFDWFAHALVLLTSSVRSWRSKTRTPSDLVDDARARLLTALIPKLVEVRSVKVPMGALYSLPREARVLTSVMIACSDPSLLQNDSTKSLPGAFDQTGVRFVQNPSTPDKQLALFYDRKLVRRRGGKDTYMALPLELGEQDDPITGLVRALEGFGLQKASVFEHMPRIVAGMFAAAHRDHDAGLSSEGTFWDTSNGRRLCRLIGFDDHNENHRDRVQQVRAVLEAFELHRETQSYNERGERVRVKVRAPLLESRAMKMDLTIEQREGFSRHHELSSWTIDEFLWKTTLNKSQGGTPAFMLIDERAFKLDKRSSVAFNIYWTLINRAYMSNATHVEQDRVSPEGVFSPRLGVLYDWSGLDRPHTKAKRVRKAFRDAFTEMINQELLLDVRCDALEDRFGVGMSELLDTRVEVKLPSSIVSVVRHARSTAR